MTRDEQLTAVKVERNHLEEKLNQLIKHIGNIPIANTKIMLQYPCLTILMNNERAKVLPSLFRLAIA